MMLPKSVTAAVVIMRRGRIVHVINSMSSEMFLRLQHLMAAIGHIPFELNSLDN